FNDDRSEVIMNAYNNGVKLIVNAASDVESSHTSIELAKKFDFIYAAVGVHPHEAEGFDDDTATIIERLSAENKVVAIGEIGLDYYYDNSPRERQKACFTRQIDIARNINMPIIVHDRDAHEDTLNIIKSENAKMIGGVLHCYTGSVEMAKELLKHNFYISVGGALTFKNARKTVEVVNYIPIDRLLIETDCPYLTPEPFRGKRNDSSYIKY
ncbi:MAG: TatD family hydrolase, partial [Ignavibacteria bacterium]|nr:TatD family hydrolase [Ignavibacteria bacterium]